MFLIVARYPAMRTELFDYDLPLDLIAQTPLPRGESRLLVLHRADGQIEHRQFPELLSYLQAGDTLVVNDTRVIARRLRALRPSGLEAEVLLLRPIGQQQWAALVKPGRSLHVGAKIILLGPSDDTSQRSAQNSPQPETALRETAQIVGETEEGGRLLEFADTAARDRVGLWGSSPLPPYIHTPLPAAEEERYQTVYARHDGSAAAPTAGLHFTENMLAQAQAQGVAIARVTLHVGVDTFRPVKTEDTNTHEMHGEWVSISEEAASIINATQGRIIAVGTTSVRALESAAKHATNTSMRVAPFTGETRLFITPGYNFRAVDALITNFHLPRSTLLMLISALAGRDAVLTAYAEAVREHYRFYSFGDAMLII